MKIEEARLVIWPFREIKGQQMGDLIDSGKINLQDLGFAIQRAYNRQVREASRTLLLHALSQNPTESTTTVGPLNVITSKWRSFSERRQMQFAMLNGTFAGFSIGILIMFSILIIFFRGEAQPPSERSLAIINSPQGIIITILVILIPIGIGFLYVRAIGWVMDRIDNQIQLHRKGQRGEERVLNAMFHVLDGKWWLFRNLELPGQKKGDIDFVLVGSKGIWALEVKAYGGEYRTVGEQWEIQYRGRWLRTFTNPSRQAKRNAASLSQILQSHNIKQWINPTVVWANQESPLTVENPAVSIWRLDELNTELNKIDDNRPIPDTQVSQIVEIFKGLYEQPFLSAETNV